MTARFLKVIIGTMVIWTLIAAVETAGIPILPRGEAPETRILAASAPIALQTP